MKLALSIIIILPSTTRAGAGSLLVANIPYLKQWDASKSNERVLKRHAVIRSRAEGVSLLIVTKD